MRLLDYIGVARRDIVTQPVRCLLTISAIIISSALFVTLVSLGLNTRSAIVDHLTSGDTLSSIVVSGSSSVGSGLFSSSVQVSNSESQKIDDTVVQKITTLPHVESATPQVAIWELKKFQIDTTDKSFVARAIATSQPGLANTKLASGAWFQNESTANEVVLGNGYMRALGVSNASDLVGKKVTITTVNGYRGVGADIPAWNANKATVQQFNNSPTTLEATVVGVTNPSANDNSLYIPLGWGHAIESPRAATPRGETSEDMIDKNGYTSVLVKADSEKNVAALTKDIENLGYGTTTYQKQIDQINQLSVVLWIVLGAVALISLVSASLGIINTLLMAISEQKTSIQIWRSCGATRGLIARVYLLQAVIIGAIGAVIGATIGMFIGNYLNAKIAAVLSSQGLESLTLPPVSMTIVASAILLTILLAAIAGAYPAYKASKRTY